MSETLSGILVMDKPQGFTSFDVIGKLRGILGTKKMGHTGTLDPMATGVLPIFVGRGTKAISFLENHDKRYLATFQLGKTSDTQDRTGTILTETGELPDAESVKKAVNGFLGEQDQTPPMYSAVKIGGKKLYELARAGKEVERPARKVHFYAITLESYDEKAGTYTIDVECSKGTYIRALCHDIGQVLGCGAILTDLRRTEACGYDLSESVTFEMLEAKAFDERATYLYPVESAFSTFPKGELLKKQADAFLNGQKLPLSLYQFANGRPDASQSFTVYEGGRFLGMAEYRSGESFVRPLRIF